MKNPTTTLAAPAGANVQRESLESSLQLGQWFWVKSDGDEGDALERGRWLGCVTEIGSNYVEIESPRTGSESWYSTRVHFDEFWTKLEAAPNAAALIAQRVAHWQGRSNSLVAEAKALACSLGLEPVSIAGPKKDAGSGTALATLSAAVDVKGHRKALEKARDKTLPDLFKRIEHANKELVRWMAAQTMPALAQVAPLKQSVAQIEDRIFNISLYAGLTEDVVQVSNGKPATIDAKLHVMQRRLYMDEECLLDYQAGGMEFKNIGAFDSWLAQPANRDRILPHPRTLVAFRVRRAEKERDSEGSISAAFVNFELAEADKTTFLYMRNGEQLWRLTCDLEFGAMIFPDKAIYDPSEPKMMKLFGARVDRLIARTEYEEMVRDFEDRKARREAWDRDNPRLPDESHWDHAHRNPHYVSSFDHDPTNEYEPFDESSVHYDEGRELIAAEIKQYNRIAVIIQGLFDRSPVFHPHAPIRAWDADGFARAITLVYDASAALNFGEKPDFEAYRDACNASIGVGSIVTGQEHYWMRVEAEKEGKRLDNDWRNRSHYRPKLFQPYGDPGPGLVGPVQGWQAKAQRATFTWERERLREKRWGDNGPVKRTLTVPAKFLFNISAYKAGDFKRFFADPRTRSEYLKWAPLLLTAEDYLAGKVERRRRRGR